MTRNKTITSNPIFPQGNFYIIPPFKLIYSTNKLSDNVYLVFCFIKGPCVDNQIKHSVDNRFKKYQGVRLESMSTWILILARRP